MDVWGMVYGFGGEFTGSRLGKDGIHMHSVVHIVDTGNWLEHIDEFDVAEIDSRFRTVFLRARLI